MATKLNRAEVIGLIKVEISRHGTQTEAEASMGLPSGSISRAISADGPIPEKLLQTIGFKEEAVYVAV